MTNETYGQLGHREMINVDLTLHTGRQVFMFSTLIMLDFAFDSILTSVPKTLIWYFCAIGFSAIMFSVAWNMTKGGKVLPVLLDLCLYDFLLQIFGMAMYALQANPTAPEPIPYHYLALTISWLKLTCMLWHMKSRNNWPVFGPFSYVNQRKTHHWGNYWRSNWTGHRLRLKLLVYPLPIVYCAAAYTLLVIRDNYPIEIRPIVAAILALVFLHQQKAHDAAGPNNMIGRRQKKVLWSNNLLLKTKGTHTHPTVSMMKPLSLQCGYRKITKRVVPRMGLNLSQSSNLFFFLCFDFRKRKKTTHCAPPEGAYRPATHPTHVNYPLHRKKAIKKKPDKNQVILVFVRRGLLII